MERWEKPSNYLGGDYSDYYVICSHHKNSGLLAESNWDEVVKRLENHVKVASCGHWMTGWIEFALIHHTDMEGIKLAQAIDDEIAEYPILNEDDFTERESKYAEELWDSMSGHEKQGYIDDLNLDITVSDTIYADDTWRLWEALVRDAA